MAQAPPAADEPVQAMMVLACDVGEIVARSAEIQKELDSGKQFPFDSLVPLRQGRPWADQASPGSPGPARRWPAT